MFAAWLPVLLPLTLALGLRLYYAFHAEPFVDEPTTMLVARAVVRSGIPVLPSGLFYGNDLPYSYLAGALVALVGPSLLALRLLSVVASVATAGLAFLAGRRLFSLRAGLWAALLLALAPQEIIWGGRARAYAVLGLLVLAAVWLFYTGLTADRAGERRARRLAWLLLAVSIFVHPEAALLLPAFVLAAVLIRGWRWWLRVDRLVELALAAAAAAGRYGLQLALARGSISGLANLTGSRPPLQAPIDLLQRLAGVAPFFVEPARLAWTLLALLALAVAARAWSERRRLAPASPQSHAELDTGAAPEGAPGIFLSTCLVVPPVLMILFLGSSYQSPRYLALLLPIFAVLAGAGLDALVGLALKAGRRPGTSGAAAPIVAAVVTLVLLAGYLPGAMRAAASREKGFAAALNIVRTQWQPGDRVATVAPAFSYLVLGRSDLFILGQEYEEFVYQGADGRWLDRWTGSPLVRTASDLRQATLAPGGGRLWLVVDDSRFRNRFDAEFDQLAWNSMELVARTGDVLVFRSVAVLPSAASHPADAVWAGQVALSGYDLGEAAHRPSDAMRAWGEVIAWPGSRLPITLRWQAVAPIAAEYTAFVHLVGADGTRYAQDDRPPLNGIQPMRHWRPGETLPDRRSLDLPAGLPPGRYRLEVGLYDASGDRQPFSSLAGEPLGDTLILDYIRVLAPGEQLPAPSRPLSVQLAGGGDTVTLLGYDLLPDEPNSMRLTLYWRAGGARQTANAQGTIGADYTVFCQLLDVSGNIAGQGDGRPLAGFYPTTAWDPGEIVADDHRVVANPGTPAGTYRLIAGLYYLPTGRRLSIQPAGPDYVDLGQVQAGP